MLFEAGAIALMEIRGVSGNSEKWRTKRGYCLTGVTTDPHQRSPEQQASGAEAAAVRRRRAHGSGSVRLDAARQAGQLGSCSSARLRSSPKRPGSDWGLPGRLLNRTLRPAVDAASSSAAMSLMNRMLDAGAAMAWLMAW